MTDGAKKLFDKYPDFYLTMKALIKGEDLEFGTYKMADSFIQIICDQYDMGKNTLPAKKILDMLLVDYPTNAKAINLLEKKYVLALDDHMRSKLRVRYKKITKITGVVLGSAVGVWAVTLPKLSRA